MEQPAHRSHRLRSRRSGVFAAQCREWPGAVPALCAGKRGPSAGDAAPHLRDRLQQLVRAESDIAGAVLAPQILASRAQGPGHANYARHGMPSPQCSTRCDEARHPGCGVDALKGGMSILGNVLAIELEIAFSETYVGSAVRANRHLHARAWFSLMKLRTESWRREPEAKSPHPATVLYGDGLYLHESRLGRRPRAAVVYQVELHDRSGQSFTQKWWQRLVGWAMRHTDGNYKTWRAWLDGCTYPSIRDFRDPDL